MDGIIVLAAAQIPQIEAPARKRESPVSLAFPFGAFWSGRRVSNSRPIPWQGIALPTELLPQNLEARAGVEPTYTDLQSGA